MKKVICLFMILVMLLGVVPISFAASETLEPICTLTAGESCELKNLYLDDIGYVVINAANTSVPVKISYAIYYADGSEYDTAVNLNYYNNDSIYVPKGGKVAVKLLSGQDITLCGAYDNFTGEKTEHSALVEVSLSAGESCELKNLNLDDIGYVAINAANTSVPVKISYVSYYADGSEYDTVVNLNYYNNDSIYVPKGGKVAVKLLSGQDIAICGAYDNFTGEKTEHSALVEVSLSAGESCELKNLNLDDIGYVAINAANTSVPVKISYAIYYADGSEYDTAVNLNYYNNDSIYVPKGGKVAVKLLSGQDIALCGAYDNFTGEKTEHSALVEVPLSAGESCELKNLNLDDIGYVAINAANTSVPVKISYVSYYADGREYNTEVNLDYYNNDSIYVPKGGRIAVRLLSGQDITLCGAYYNYSVLSSTATNKHYSDKINAEENRKPTNSSTNNNVDEDEDIITTVGNSLNLTNNSFYSLGATEDTLRGPKITILGKSFYLFELPINMSIKTPLYNIKYNADKEKYEIMLGKMDKTALAGEDDKNKTYNEIKEFVNYCGKSTSTDTWNRYQHLQKVLKSDNMSFGFSFNATPAGYMEFDKSGKLLEGAIVYVLNMDANYKQPIPAVPVVYVKVGIGVDATGKFGIKSIESNAYSLFGSLGLDVAPYVGVGVGSSKIVNVEGGAKLKLKTQLEIVKNKKLSEIFSASMTGQLYLKLKALSFINFDKKWDIASVSIYPDFGASLMSLAEKYDDMVVMPRDYADEKSEFEGNNISLFGLDNIDIATFKTNVYPYAEPQLVKLEDGNELLVWIDNDNLRSDINCTVLKYSVNNGGKWSTPADIYNDGKADFSPRLAVTEDGAVLVWQKANSVLDDDTSLPEMAKDIDIYYSSFDGKSWETPINVSDTEDTYEYAPDIAVNGDEITISWITNSENDYFAFSGTNTIYSKVFNGSWSDNSIIAADLGSVANLNVCYIDGKAAITYTEDTDNNIETSGDVELFEIYDGQLTRITDDEVVDYALTKTNDGYYWIHNNQLWVRDENGIELVEIPILPVYLNNAKILANGSDKVIVYEHSDEYSSDLYAMYYDSDDKSWGEPVRLTEDNKKIRETSGYLTTDGALRLVFGQAEIDESADDIYGKCNLMLANITEKSDIEVICANCVYNEYVAGEETTIYVNVKNNSSSKISKLNVKMTVNNNTVISQNVDTELLSGSTTTIEVPYTLPNDLSNKAYTVTVTPAEKTDDDLSDNTAIFELGFADVKVDVRAKGKTVTANIANIGCLDAENIICSIAASDGTVLATKTIDSLAVDASKDVQFTNVNSDSVVVSVTTDSKENFYANNTVSVSLLDVANKGVYVALGKYTADEETVKVDATIASDYPDTQYVNVYVAFYKGDELINLQSEPVTLDSQNTARTISRELPSEMKADKAKIFIWEIGKKIYPYNEAAVLNITYPEK